jgi:hypothetical protein
MVEGKGGKEIPQGMGWKVSLSIIGGVGWLVFLILWLFFYASNYLWEKNVAIFLLSLLVMGCILGLPWMIWGIHHRTELEKEMWRTKGFRWRVWLSMILALIVIIFLIYWFWYLAEPYTLYQNLAIIIVSILIAGGIIGASWAPWGMKYGDTFNKKK